jgi:serine/threonine protein kinase
MPFYNPQNAVPISPTYSRTSSIAPSVDQGVLAPGDVVGEGISLQGELIRLVSSGSSPTWPNHDHGEPATEFEVVRRLGTGSYAVVYLVQEVLFRPAPSEDGHMSTIGSMEFSDDGKFARNPETIYGRNFAIKCLSKANLDKDALAAQMSEVCRPSIFILTKSDLGLGYDSPVSPSAYRHRDTASYPGDTFVLTAPFGVRPW